LIRGFVKRSLSLFLALKTIVKIPEIFPLSALLEVIKVVTEVAILFCFAIAVVVRFFGSLRRVQLDRVGAVVRLVI
jgi:hypothetical protein